MKKAIGIIGGMGPLATVDLFNKIIEVTDAQTDQEHIRVFIDNNTNIPDRTKAIVSDGENPVFELVKSAVTLQNVGADVIIMPCNTAHYFYDEIQQFIDIPFLNMPEETAKKLNENNIAKVGLLATDGTIESKVYEKVLKSYGIETVIPSPDSQRYVMDIIYKGVKAGNTEAYLDCFQEAMKEVLGRGAETLILGCTELPVVFAQFKMEFPFVDPTNILAISAVKFVKGRIALHCK